MVPMGEVKTGDVHASIDHLDKRVNVPAGGTHGANDLGLAQIGIDVFEDVGELNSV